MGPGAPLLAFEKWPAENRNRALGRQHRGPLLKKREKWRTPVGSLDVKKTNALYFAVKVAHPPNRVGHRTLPRTAELVRTWLRSQTQSLFHSRSDPRCRGKRTCPCKGARTHSISSPFFQISLPTAEKTDQQHLPL